MTEERGIVFAVTDQEDRTMMMGERQTIWLRNEGLLSEVETGDPYVRLFRSEEKIGVLNHMLFSRLELRECDYCRVTGAPWEIPCRPFKLTTGPAPGPLGGPERPMVACSVCVELIRDNRKRELVERIVTEALAEGRRRGGNLRKIVMSHPERVLREQILPIAKDVVNGTFANRMGFPVRTDVV